MLNSEVAAIQHGGRLFHEADLGDSVYVPKVDYEHELKQRAWILGTLGSEPIIVGNLINRCSRVETVTLVEFLRAAGYRNTDTVTVKLRKDSIGVDILGNGVELVIWANSGRVWAIYGGKRYRNPIAFKLALKRRGEI